MRGGTDSWKITGHHHPKIQGTALTECWAGFCRLRSSCSGDTSLFALVCRSAAGRHRTCARWVPACSCWSPHALGSQGSPGNQQHRKIRTYSECKKWRLCYYLVIIMPKASRVKDLGPQNIHSCLHSASQLLNCWGSWGFILKCEKQSLKKRKKNGSIQSGDGDLYCFFVLNVL